MQNTKRNPVKKPRKPKKNITHADLLMAMASAKKPNAKIEITIFPNHFRNLARKNAVLICSRYFLSFLSIYLSITLRDYLTGGAGLDASFC
jgi:hypothetical protein